MLLIQIILTSISGILMDEFCSINDRNDCETIKYTKYLDMIKKAKEIYVKCDKTDCNCYKNVIENDLKPFRNGITKNDIDKIRNKGITYKIIENRLYRDKTCLFPARCGGIEHFLLKLLKNKQPNIEMVVNVRDWPQINRNFGVNGPVLSFSKTDDYLDIMYPAWAFWEGGPAINLYPKGIGRWDKHRKILGKLGNETLWQKKAGKAFFRGSRTSPERDPLILLSRANPDLVDAKYTKNQAWKSDSDTLNAPPAAEMGFKAHCDYKYLFNFRGVAASFRFKHLFLCKSLVIHVGDEWQEFFYSALKPWIHYIPLNANINSNQIIDLLEFLQNHDDLAEEIAINGYNFIWNHLKQSDIYCYWGKLLENYGKLLKFQPELNGSDWIEITSK